MEIKPVRTDKEYQRALKRVNEIVDCDKGGA